MQAGPKPGTGGQRRYTAIRTPDNRVLMRWHTGASELYNLNRDPFQMDGRTSEGETAEERNILASRLANLRNCAGVSCW